jgi:hypothetical protein
MKGGAGSSGLDEYDQQNPNHEYGHDPAMSG